MLLTRYNITRYMHMLLTCYIMCMCMHMCMHMCMYYYL